MIKYKINNNGIEKIKQCVNSTTRLKSPNSSLISFKSENIFYPFHPVRCMITGPSECGKSYFLTNLILKIVNEYDKKYINSPSLHQDIYQKLIKCFNAFLPIHTIPKILNEKDIDVVIQEKNNEKRFKIRY